MQNLSLVEKNCSRYGSSRLAAKLETLTLNSLLRSCLWIPGNSGSLTSNSSSGSSQTDCLKSKLKKKWFNLHSYLMIIINVSFLILCSQPHSTLCRHLFDSILHFVVICLFYNFITIRKRFFIIFFINNWFFYFKRFNTNWFRLNNVNLAFIDLVV